MKSQSISTGNVRTDGELCRNTCGFYGNKIWDGFCSKCYREVYHQVNQIQEPTSDSQEKRRSNNLNLRNPIRQMVNRAGNLRSSSTSAISAVLNDEQILENEDDGKDLDLISTDDARMDIKAQVKNFVNSFQKKCTNQKISLDILAQDYANFKEIIAQRMQTNSIYRDETEELIPHIRDYIEKMIFSKNYSSIFNRLSSECEEQDLSIQNRISSLHWITPTMLEAVFNENLPNTREMIYKAINALIELDSKSTPQRKIHSIMECKSFIEEGLRSTSGITINADCFLPALIYVVLKAKPPRLHSNIQFLSRFSQPSGEELYYLANLDSAVRFIELLQAEHLGLSLNDFSLYMRGEPVLPSEFVPLFDYPMEHYLNLEQWRKFSIQQGEIEQSCEKFNDNLSDLNKRLVQSSNDIEELLNNSYTRFSPLEQIPQSSDRNDK